MKKLYFLLILIYSSPFFSQITITEVYYDTPYNEKLRWGTDVIVEAKKHHRGEFIELYNNSDSDINLKGWFLSDLQATFWLPDKIIRSGEFMLVAYSTLPYNTTLLDEHFTDLTSKRNQIIYQDVLILRNKHDKVILGHSFNGFVNKIIDVHEWEFRSNPPSNYVKDVWQSPQEFYKVQSIQYNPSYSSGVQDPEDIYDNFRALPNPLSATYKPTTVNYENTVKEYFQTNYGFLDWGDEVKKLVGNTCPVTIEKTSQSPSGIFNEGNKCFSFDMAGNETDALDCSSTQSSSSSDSNFDALAEIANSIVIYPNPTRDQVTITWGLPAKNKISSLKVYNAAGGLVYNHNPAYSYTDNYSVTFSLRNELPGVFIATFITKDGSPISKKILKL